MKFRWLFTLCLGLGALLMSFAPAQEVCSITGTTRTIQEVAVKTACCETTCSHCEGKASSSKAKASPLCMENGRVPALSAVFIPKVPENGTNQPVYMLPSLALRTETRSFQNTTENDTSPPYFTGRILLSTVLRS